MDLRENHKQSLKQLEQHLAGNTQPLRIKKKTISNLFRYDGRIHDNRREIDLSEFDKPLYLDVKSQTLEVQGLTTFERIVDFVLPKGFLPMITPELKHITIGGATVGIGIEANSYKFGFVHNSLLEADVLLPDGHIITCTADNKYADLFHGLPNSYGTLGYILRVKIKLRRIKPFVTLRTERYDTPKKFLTALKKASEDPKNDAVESLVYSEKELYLTTARETDHAEDEATIYGSTIFYKMISRPGQFSLPIKEYTFRYDPEWFWNVPESPMFQLFRKLAPRVLRNSAFYTHYSKRASKLPFINVEAKDTKLEQLIQDWEVPWRHAEALLNTVLTTADLNGKPIAVVLVNVPKSATCYPLKAKQLYFNIGSYSFVKKNPSQQPYAATKRIDAFCFNHDGIKMLYSTSFVNEPEFNRIYNGKAYATLKKKYDPKGFVPTLYEKAVRGY
jgi:hypothetical protein